VILQRFWREQGSFRVQAASRPAFAASEAALDLLNDKLEDQPQTFTVNGLLDVVDTTMKRFGYEPPARGGVAVNVNVGLVSPAELEAARERMRSPTTRGAEGPPGDSRYELELRAEGAKDRASEEELGDDG
jgi:hypothetical protein